MTRKLLPFCLAALIVGGRLTAAEPAVPGQSPDTNGRLRLIFITCSVEAKFFEPIKKGIADAARLLDVECEFTGTIGVDLKKQADMVRRAVADGYDGIALNLVDTEAFDGVVKETLAKGVPIVGFNTDDHSTPNARLSCVNQRLYEAGKSLAQRVSPRIKPGSHILMTMHDHGISSLNDRLRGEQEILKAKNVKWTVLVSGNNEEKGAEAIAKALREHPEIRVILGTGQADTESAGRAIKAHFGGQGYWSAGFDLSPVTLQLIREGHILCTVDQQPYMQGFYPVVQLTQLLRYGIQPSDIDAGAAIIDQSNVDKVIELSRQHYRSP